jgi:magnesium chelatase family protein
MPTPDPGDAVMPDLRDIKGQETAKRALEVAAAGGHNLLMIGPPGAGKSMLAKRLPSLLPPLQPAEMLEVSMIRSLAGDLAGGRIGRTRPFRAPHHSASMAALVGAARARGRAKWPWRISACCSSTNFRSSPRKCSMRCANRSRLAIR